MTSENAAKEIVKSFIDLANMAKGLINENQQPSVQQETIPQYTRWKKGVLLNPATTDQPITHHFHTNPPTNRPPTHRRTDTPTQ